MLPSKTIENHVRSSPEMDSVGRAFAVVAFNTMGTMETCALTRSKLWPSSSIGWDKRSDTMVTTPPSRMTIIAANAIISTFDGHGLSLAAVSSMEKGARAAMPSTRLAR